MIDGDCNAGWTSAFLCAFRLHILHLVLSCTGVKDDLRFALWRAWILTQILDNFKSLL